MHKWGGVIFIGMMGWVSMVIANQSQEICDETEMSTSQKTRVQLFYSGPISRTSGEEDLREKDYEWPGMNEDSFYDFFTR